ncbi:DEAD/DEAH box helicase [Candidatus Pacearchaeota archaeon]|nr:DEAD/DEAH box helicase [Candidatus Pacearchaeota archaeon]
MMEKFKQLGLSEGMLHAIKSAGFSEPSEIQEKTIPLVVSGKDVIGSSATGSGKTLAFGAGIIDKVKRGGGIQALVLVPTRELAEQVALNLRRFSHYLGLNVREIYGGVGMEPQIRGLRNTDIVVGTPGRILDHLQRRTLNLSKVKYLVLDEADRMLDMGFIRDVESILKSCPQPRQTMLFSATISNEIRRIADRHMKDPEFVAVNNQVDPSKLYQVYYDVTSDIKFSLLVHLLKLEKNGVVMVFCNTRRNVDRLTQALHEQNIHAMAIHGGLSQNRRSSTLQSFHERETLILVCTDVAARGLDIKDVSHVYNFDIPTVDTDYIHRIGRTARAGKEGKAISFVAQGDHTEFRQISRSLPIEKLNVPKFENVGSVNFGSNEDRKANRARGRGGGRSFGGRQGGRGRFGGSREGRSGSRFGRGNRQRFHRR